MRKLREIITSKYVLLVLAIGLGFVTYKRVMTEEWVQALISALMTIALLRTAIISFFKSKV